MTSRKSLLLLGLLAACAARRPSTVVFMSDFGTADDSVAICKGVMLGLEPRLRIVDLTHDVPRYSIADGARWLAGTAPYYPAGTVFLAVVDPGVGTTRRAIVVATNREQYFVVPDNGLITMVAEQDGIRAARAIENRQWIGGQSSTFHGRDIFSPVAARLARGDDWRDVGPPVASPVRIEIEQPRVVSDGLEGKVIGTDGPFGNLVTNIDADAFRTLGWGLGDTVPLRVGTRELRLPFVRTFGDVPVGSPLLYVDSRGRIALAVNQGDFAARHAVTPPVPLFIPRRAH